MQERGGGVGGGAVLSQSSALGPSGLQLSLWQHHTTEGFIVICNYVVFSVGPQFWCAPTLGLFLSQGILSRRTEGGWGRAGGGHSWLFILNSEGADMAARSGGAC